LWQVHVEVPVGSTAHVVLDGKALATDVKATIDGKDAQDVQGVKVRDTTQHTKGHHASRPPSLPFSRLTPAGFCVPCVE
jgi:hypothetical protein